MATIICCTAKTEGRARLIREHLRLLGHDECFEERIHRQELLLSVRLDTPRETASIVETFQNAGGVDVTSWEERAA